LYFQLGTQQRISEQFRKAAELSGMIIEKSIPYNGLPVDPSASCSTIAIPKVIYDIGLIHD